MLENIFALFIICQIICSYKSYFAQPTSFCPRLASQLSRPLLPRILKYFPIESAAFHHGWNLLLKKRFSSRKGLNKIVKPKMTKHFDLKTWKSEDKNFDYWINRCSFLVKSIYSILFSQSSYCPAYREFHKLMTILLRAIINKCCLRLNGTYNLFPWNLWTWINLLVCLFLFPYAKLYTRHFYFRVRISIQWPAA